MGRPRKKNRWQDHYAHKARKERYAARSVYKLEEIQKKHRLISNGAHVLDLGCAPGSWLQFAGRLTGSRGRVVGIDLKAVKVPLPGNVRTVAADIDALDWEADPLLAGGFDVLLSDMAPSTTGNKHADSARSFVLCGRALEIAGLVLRPGGHFVCKIFQGEDFKAFCDLVKDGFTHMHIFKPQSSRKGSKEIFVIGVGKRA